MSHTKGPWYLDGVDIFPAGVHPANNPICTMSPGQGEQLYKNANLISASPDLLNELSFIVDNEESSCFEQWLSRYSPSGDCDSVHHQWLDSSDFEEFCDLWKGPISAIRKARGQ